MKIKHSIFFLMLMSCSCKKRAMNNDQNPSGINADSTQNSSETIAKCVDLEKRYSLVVKQASSQLLDEKTHEQSEWNCRKPDEGDPPCCDQFKLVWTCTHTSDARVLYWQEGGFAGQKWVEIHPDKDNAQKLVEFYCQK